MLESQIQMLYCKKGYFKYLQLGCSYVPYKNAIVVAV